MEISDIEQKSFRSRVMGLDPKEVESFLQQLTDEIRRLKAENENLKREVQARELEIRGHKERESTINNVLITAQKNAEQTRANAEREARLIVSEAEVQAERILKGASENAIRMEREMSELKRHRIQFGARMRALLDTLRQVLDEDGKDRMAEAEEERSAQAPPPAAAAAQRPAGE